VNQTIDNEKKNKQNSPRGETSRLLLYY